jgi:hypothetical protein
MLAASCLLCGCGSPTAAATVTVLGSWTGDEQSGFLAMIRGFEEKYGIQVNYTGTRDASAVLASDLENGSPPDLAVLATPGELRQDAANGTLVPIDAALGSARLTSEYGHGWLHLMPGHRVPRTTTRSSSRRRSRASSGMTRGNCRHATWRCSRHPASPGNSSRR